MTIKHLDKTKDRKLKPQEYTLQHGASCRKIKMLKNKEIRTKRSGNSNTQLDKLGPNVKLVGGKGSADTLEEIALNDRKRYR